MIIAAKDVQEQSRFMEYVMGNIARKVGRLHRWQERFWGRRYRAIPILDDDALVQRMRYVLSNGVKEGLVAEPGLWPGVHVVDVFTKGRKLEGVWYDRTREYQRRRRGVAFAEDEFATVYPVHIATLPFLEGQTPEQQRRYYCDMVESAGCEAREALKASGKVPIGRRRVLKRKPHHRPKPIAKRPAPLCHTTQRALRCGFRTAYRDFVQGYRDALKHWASTAAASMFPNSCLLPSMVGGFP